MDDRTSDLTDDQLYATMGEHWPDPGKIISEQEYSRRYAASLRAVAALARQGWAPVGTGPSIEDLGSLIVWLTDMAIQAADAGRTNAAGMLTWASLVLGERVNEDAPDHVANVSNMV
jgi:hypothetical protein